MPTFIVGINIALLRSYGKYVPESLKTYKMHGHKNRPFFTFIHLDLKNDVVTNTNVIIIDDNFTTV